MIDRTEILALADRVERTPAYGCKELHFGALRRVDSPAGNHETRVRVILIDESNRGLIAKALRQLEA